MKNLIKYLTFLGVTFFLLSCNNGEKEIPKDIIPKDKMVEVITEIELSQALIKLKFSNQDSIINQQQLFNQVYNNFDISQDEFNNSLSYYCKDPKTLENIYVRVINNLSEKQVESQK